MRLVLILLFCYNKKKMTVSLELYWSPLGNTARLGARSMLLCISIEGCINSADIPIRGRMLYPSKLQKRYTGSSLYIRSARRISWENTWTVVKSIFYYAYIMEAAFDTLASNSDLWHLPFCRFRLWTGNANLIFVVKPGAAANRTDCWHGVLLLLAYQYQVKTLTSCDAL